MARVRLEGVSKVYPNGTSAVEDLDLEIPDGSLTVLVGPSGCGKSTTLRMVAGLEEVSKGSIWIGDKIVNTLDPSKRDIAMIFQNYALYPHMRIFENIAFPLRSQRLPNSEVRERVMRVAEMLGLRDMLERKPRTLSGGQRQRVAMGRAIVQEPQVFLMDEPLSNLDARLRVQMRREISGLQHELNATTIYVTHDQVEAMTMGDQIAILRNGKLQQVGPPQVLYDHPTNLFVAAFMGAPAMNLIRSRIEEDKGGDLTCILGEQRLILEPETVARTASIARYLNREIVVGMRPELLAIPEDSGDARARLRGEVIHVEALGRERLVYVTLPGQPVMIDEVKEAARDSEAFTLEALTNGQTQIVTVVERSDHVAPAKTGSVIEINVTTANLHFFDLDTGLAIN